MPSSSPAKPSAPSTSIPAGANQFSDEEVRFLSARRTFALAIERPASTSASWTSRTIAPERKTLRARVARRRGRHESAIPHGDEDAYHSLDSSFPAPIPRQDAQILGDKIEHLNKIVEQILAFARPQSRSSPRGLERARRGARPSRRHKLRTRTSSSFISSTPASFRHGRRHATRTGLPQLILNAAEAMPGAAAHRQLTRASARQDGRPTHVAVEFKTPAKA